MIVNTIRNHHPDRLTSWRRLIVTANPGINRAREPMVSRTDAPPNSSTYRIVATIESSIENTVHHQYSDRLDLVLKSKYLRNPEEIA